MQRLSSSPAEIRPRYDVVVIGSGYGGGIAASRLARAGRNVCVLERGREFLPGEFPETLPRAAVEVQASLPHAHVGNPSGLFDFLVDDDINVLRGCGLGGTSLINANVAIRPDHRVFEDPVWPAALRADVDTRLMRGYRRASEMLRPTPYPATSPPLAKLNTLERSAKRLGETFRRVDLNVTFDDLSAGNHVGVPQNACTSCGDCVSGCNQAAKNTTAMNYLPDAQNHGAQIFCGVLVRRIEKNAAGLVVYYVLLGAARERFDGPELFVEADVVVLGAGALGSTEILLRSANHGLSISEQVGRRFGGNGDVLGFSYNGKEPVNGIGLGHRKPRDHEPVGPCIAGVIDARGQSPTRRRDRHRGGRGSRGARAATAGSADDGGQATLAERRARAQQGGKDCRKPDRRRVPRRRAPYANLPGHGSRWGGRTALSRLRPATRALARRWQQTNFASINRCLEDSSAANGGTYLKNPTWSKLLRHALVTVHPLGGCPMGEDAGTGVVNHKGQVFRGSTGDDVHEGLYVADGAIVPRSLGANPLFTISALAERICELIAEDRGWTIDEQPLKKPQLAQPVPAKAGVQFTETMKGFFSKDPNAEYEAGYQEGERAGSSFRFVLTISAQDAEAMISDPQHLADMVGTVEAPALSPHPLAVSQGKFNLFIHSNDQVDTKKMIYRMVLTDVAGKSYFFHGFKLVHDDQRHDLWSDTTTLKITLYEGTSGEGPVVGKGILRLDAEDFAKQLTTMKALDAPDSAAGLRVLGRFGEAFAGELLETYGGVLAPNRVLAPYAAPRVRRPLRAPVPESHTIKTQDGVRLKLTRYPGGLKGPSCSPPASATAPACTPWTRWTRASWSIWSIVTTTFGCSIGAQAGTPAARTPYTIDDEANYDWPAAIQAVRRLTGAPDVQVVAHCMGAMTLLMATMLGMEGVRSAVCSQVTTYFPTDSLNRLKAQLRVADGLKALGVANVTAHVRPNVGDAAIEAALRFFPSAGEEHCQDPVCHRIFGIFGPVYAHSQLDPATHRAMSEIFGVANVTVLRHLLKILGAGHAVDADGTDVYRPRIARLSYPIHFIAGEKNQICKPSGSEQQYEELSRLGGAKYTRRVYADYAHLDCFVGRNAARDVFPDLVDQLDHHPAKVGS